MESKVAGEKLISGGGAGIGGDDGGFATSSIASTIESKVAGEKLISGCGAGGGGFTLQLHSSPSSNLLTTLASISCLGGDAVANRGGELTSILGLGGDFIGDSNLLGGISSISFCNTFRDGTLSNKSANISALDIFIIITLIFLLCSSFVRHYYHHYFIY
jgi:hypothetical protein